MLPSTTRTHRRVSISFVCCVVDEVYARLEQQINKSRVPSRVHMTALRLCCCVPYLRTFSCTHSDMYGNPCSRQLSAAIIYILRYQHCCPSTQTHFAQQFARFFFFSKQTVSRSADSMHLFCLSSSSSASPSSFASIVELSRLICCAFLLFFGLCAAVLYHGPSIYIE